MKALTLILIYITTFAFLFFVFSLFGMLWTTYYLSITNPDWFIVYSLLLGSWLSAFPCHEYYELNREYFRKIAM